MTYMAPQSKAERLARETIRLLYLDALEAECQAENWLDIDESDRNRILRLYRVWRWCGYQNVDDEGDVIEEWALTKLGMLQAKAEQDATDESIELAGVASRLHGGGE